MRENGHRKAKRSGAGISMLGLGHYSTRLSWISSSRASAVDAVNFYAIHALDCQIRVLLVKRGARSAGPNAQP